jgi:hypothetical protein
MCCRMIMYLSEESKKYILKKCFTKEEKTNNIMMLMNNKNEVQNKSFRIYQILVHHELMIENPLKKKHLRLSIDMIENSTF